MRLYTRGMDFADQFRRKLEQNGRWILFCVAVTFCWGLLAHGYCFFDNSFSHDSLKELHGAIFGNDHKINIGRVFVPLYRDLFRGDATMPWLIGALALLWTGLAVFLTTRIFHVRSKPTAILIAGIFTANITVSATAATYLHDLDCYMLSLLCAVCAVYLWNRYSWGCWAGAVFVAASLGLYQSFFCVSVTMAMLVSLFDLYNGKRFKAVFVHGLRALGMLALGGALYVAAMAAVQALTNIPLETGNYNSMDSMLGLNLGNLPALVAAAYGDFFYRLINTYSAYPAFLVKGITAVLLLISAAALGVGLKGMGWAERLLCLALVALLPLGTNLIYILTMGYTSDLTVYAIWLVHLMMLLSGQWLCAWIGKRKAAPRAGALVRGVTMALVFALAYGNVQFSNGMYLKKDLEYDAYLSLMTRVVYRLESTPGYVPQETPVYFAGLPKELNPVIPGFKEYRNVDGMISSDVLYVPQRIRYQAYFDYVMGLPIQLAEEKLWRKMDKQGVASQMPSYPAQGCIGFVDGVLVVKMG